MNRSNIDEGELRGIRAYCDKEIKLYKKMKSDLEHVKGEAASLTEGVEAAQQDFNDGYKSDSSKRNEIFGQISNVANLITTFISNLTKKISEVDQRISFYEVFRSNCDSALAEAAKITANINEMNIFESNAAIKKQAEIRYNVNGNTVTVVTN